MLSWTWLHVVLTPPTPPVSPPCRSRPQLPQYVVDRPELLAEYNEYLTGKEAGDSCSPVARKPREGEQRDDGDEDEEEGGEEEGAGTPASLGYAGGAGATSCKVHSSTLELPRVPYSVYVFFLVGRTWSADQPGYSGFHRLPLCRRVPHVI